MPHNTKQNEHEHLKRNLRVLRLLEILRIYPDMLDRATSGDWSSLRLIAHLMRTEAASRPQRTFQDRIRRARLPRLKTLQEYDFTFLKEVSKQKILRLFDCGFVATHRNVVFLGKEATGKTHLLTALGYVACGKGISVRFTRTTDMINELSAAQLAGTLGKVLRTYTQPSLLLLDELGNLPADKSGADLLFQVVTARYETASIAITTNRPFRGWRAILHLDDSLAAALIERLMHHGEAILIQGAICRMKDKAQDPDTPQ